MIGPQIVEFTASDIASVLENAVLTIEF